MSVKIGSLPDNGGKSTKFIQSGYAIKKTFVYIVHH